MQRGRPLVEIPDEGVIVLVATAVLNGGKVLVVREEESPYHQRWVLPQGYVRNNETLADGARREVREELGIEVAILRPIGTYEDIVKEKASTVHYVIVCFLGEPSADATITSTAEAIDSAWIDPADGLNEAPKVVQQILKDIAKIVKGGRKPK